MHDDSKNSNKSITQTQPEIISLAGDPGAPKHPKLVFVTAVAAMLLFIAAVAGWKALQISKAIAMGKAYKMPPDAVTAMTLSEETVSPVLEAVGSVSSPQGVMLSADLPEPSRPSALNRARTPQTAKSLSNSTRVRKRRNSGRPRPNWTSPSITSNATPVSGKAALSPNTPTMSPRACTTPRWHRPRRSKPLSAERRSAPPSPGNSVSVRLTRANTSKAVIPSSRLRRLIPST